MVNQECLSYSCKYSISIDGIVSACVVRINPKYPGATGPSRHVTYDAYGGGVAWGWTISAIVNATYDSVNIKTGASHTRCDGCASSLGGCR